ncbi:protein PET100 homolog, mitochondrial [Topomyia yanbarensis]|uniref:protein PET100 homolog, mitochondrial n=1 Tax=Topomyia yanbarensis TaxID=2498891 RepID=UPI00273CCAF0|nr:protein PET100 homolog, mitochondrial [Topomyia yanbarensis]
MGGWALEVGKMALYMTFPVAMFHWFNQPEYFEKWVTETKRQIYPPENKKDREDLNNCIRSIREKRDIELLNALKELEKQEKK